MLENISAYKKTTVNWTESQGSIINLLERHGIEEVRFTNLSWATVKRAGLTMQEDTFAVMIEFMKPVEAGTVPVRIVLPNVPKRVFEKSPHLTFLFIRDRCQTPDH